ncbi:hypothetical protein ACJX0J_011607, partial [Zea mays]
ICAGFFAKKRLKSSFSFAGKQLVIHILLDGGFFLYFGFLDGLLGINYVIGDVEHKGKLQYQLSLRKTTTSARSNPGLEMKTEEIMQLIMAILKEILIVFVHPPLGMYPKRYLKQTTLQEYLLADD